MGDELLVNEQIDAGEEFIRDFNHYVPVNAAFWLRPADSEEWFLYIASDAIDDTNIDIAYGEVLKTLGSKKSQWLNPFRVKLLNSTEPLVREVIEIRDRYPANVPTRYHGSSIAGMGIEDSFIYPRQPAINSAP